MKFIRRQKVLTFYEQLGVFEKTRRVWEQMSFCSRTSKPFGSVRLTFSVIYEAIANTTFRQDVVGIGRVFFYFFAQVVNVQAQIMGFVAVFITPNFGEQGFVGDNPASVLNEGVEQTIFGWAQIDSFAGDDDLVAIEVYGEAVVDGEYGAGRGGWPLCSA
jgi:hypothetical protein